ncbi:MAG: DUF4190 domain-containing protein [Bacteroidia bacterium]|nr:DUF4190 domain-containing protein [Bacteroidia bacterium]
MKNTLQFILIFVAFGIFISSCTTEKRLYMPGFHVEWKKSQISKDKINLTNNVNSSIKNEAIEVNNLYSQVQNYDSTLLADNNNSNIIVSIDKSTSNTTFDNITNKSLKAIEEKQVLQKKKVNTKNKNTTERKNITIDDRTIGLFAVLGFLLALLGIGLLLLQVTPVVSIILSATAVILSLIAKHQMSLSHTEIKGKGFAIFGIILGWIGLGAAFFYLLILSL